MARVQADAHAGMSPMQTKRTRRSAPGAIINQKDHMNTVCITMNNDGTYGVHMEDEGMSEEGMPEAEPQTFETAEEACQAAIQMLGPVDQEPMIEGEEDVQKSFEAGFKGVRG